jgi:hypothetical protein
LTLRYVTLPPEVEVDVDVDPRSSSASFEPFFSSQSPKKTCAPEVYSCVTVDAPMPWAPPESRQERDVN